MAVKDTIQWFKDNLSQNRDIGPAEWIEGAEKLNLQLSEERHKLFDLQQAVAKQRVALIENGKSVAHARTFIEASDEYKEMLKQKALIDETVEFIRLAKLHGKLASEELKGY